MFSKDMKTVELLKLAKSEGKELSEILAEYTEWQREQGLIAKPVLPSVALAPTLGSESPAREAMLAVLDKAMNLLNDPTTFDAGSNIIIRVYDSLHSVKSVTNAVQINIKMEAEQKAERLKMLRKMAGVEPDVIEAEVE